MTCRQAPTLLQPGDATLDHIASPVRLLVEVRISSPTLADGDRRLDSAAMQIATDPPVTVSFIPRRPKRRTTTADRPSGGGPVQRAVGGIADPGAITPRVRTSCSAKRRNYLATPGGVVGCRLRRPASPPAGGLLRLEGRMRQAGTIKTACRPGSPSARQASCRGSR